MTEQSRGRLPRNSTPLSSFRSDSSNLDLVRTLAVLSVFFSHLHVALTDRISSVDSHFGRMGVLIFFVHTSMVLMLSLERTKLEGNALVGSFYLRRLFRIYPLAMVCVTAVMLFGRVPNAGAGRSWRLPEYLSNMALTTNLTNSENMVGGLWTLPLEVQMYLALPFLFLLGRLRSHAILFSTWVASIAIALLQPHISGRLNVLGFAPCFISGVIAWKLSLSVPRRLAGWLWPIGFVATWPLLFLAESDNSMYYQWGFCFVLGLAIPWFKEIRFRPIQVAAHVVAKYSYGIYLSHIVIMTWSFALPVPMAVRWIIFAVWAAIVPVAMYHFIEQPLIAVGQKVAARVFSTPVELRHLSHSSSLKTVGIAPPWPTRRDARSLKRSIAGSIR